MDLWAPTYVEICRNLAGVVIQKGMEIIAAVKIQADSDCQHSWAGNKNDSAGHDGNNVCQFLVILQIRNLTFWNLS